MYKNTLKFKVNYKYASSSLIEYLFISNKFFTLSDEKIKHLKFDK